MIEYIIQRPDTQGWLALHLTETAPGGDSFSLFSVNGESRHLLEAFIAEFTRADRDRTRLLWDLKKACFYKREGDTHTYRPKYPLLRSIREQRECKQKLRQIETMIDEACNHVGIRGH